MNTLFLTDLSLNPIDTITIGSLSEYGEFSRECKTNSFQDNGFTQKSYIYYITYDMYLTRDIISNLKMHM